jgi:cyanate permease
VPNAPPRAHRHGEAVDVDGGSVMSLKRALAHRYLLWLLMFLSAVAVTLIVGTPLRHFPRPELLIFFIEVLSIGSLISLSLTYFSLKVNNEKISRLVAAGFLTATIFFPNFGPALFGRVFTTADPVISALLVMLTVSIALNIALYFVKRDAPPNGG